VLENITADYPPAFITTACHDFLRDAADPMGRFLSGKGIPCAVKCYGSEEDPSIGHVFHVNILLKEAMACNDESAEFFRKYL
jgi:acetyl esterase/lipase